MHQQQTPSPLCADVARLGAKAAAAAIEHRVTSSAKAAVADAAAERAAAVLRQGGHQAQVIHRAREVAERIRTKQPVDDHPSAAGETRLAYTAGVCSVLLDQLAFLLERAQGGA